MEDAFSGFGHPAVITVAMVLVAAVPRGSEPLRAGDILSLEADPASLQSLMDSAKLTLGAAILIAPMAISTATRLNLSADPFLMAVAVISVPLILRFWPLG